MFGLLETQSIVLILERYVQSHNFKTATTKSTKENVKNCERLSKVFSRAQRGAADHKEKIFLDALPYPSITQYIKNYPFRGLGPFSSHANRCL